ncbi:DUF3006 domain-containing protein [Microbacterium sp. APC 3898]|uniref:DUF3006 domain-containing protein n=1 Tax=Planococcus notacanthi TaxID=3035188 RepID=A0ABT7ZMK3_9BACL|nr:MULTISPECIES: DUF3006 domain-containing protein [Terrabacteria group]MDN3428068.1 DUF3006 domain-containing protein [Planococcus sp. APC 4016]MDN3438988.1 DUF3006 domain-containing protein [Planococcus sp. APC 3900]MDN3498397.1 DUF3006 domain-containing protein [Microbacterium sp. APC 3898]
MKGILDRIEDGRHAVILVEEEGVELVLPANRLPEGSQVNSWFTIDAENGQLAVTLDEETSIAKTGQAEELMTRLRTKKKRSRFKRN